MGSKSAVAVKADNKVQYSRHINRLQREGKIPFLFIGSGFTKRYIHTALSWEELLSNLANIIGISDFQMQSLRITLEKDYTKGTVNQKIASYLNDQLLKKISVGEDSTIFSPEEKQQIIDNKIDPFKYLIARIIQIDSLPSPLDFENERYKIGELNSFKKLKKNIPGIITTNYDQFIELLFQNEYKAFINQSDYFYSDNYNFAEIYKIHGCLTNPNSLIITEEDYIDFNNKSYLTTSKLLQILSNNPIVFIGYSLNDEDIKSIINNLISCLTDEQIKILEKNLLFINWEYHVKIYKEHFSEFVFGNKRMYIPTITTDNFTRLYNDLSNFKTLLSPIELRRYKTTLSKLINSNDRNLPTIFANIDLEIADFDETSHFISSIGMSPKAETKLSPKDVIQNYLLERKLFPKESILEWTKTYFRANCWVPLYAYLDVDSEIAPSIIKFKETKESQIINYKKKYEKLGTITTIDQLIQYPQTSKKFQVLINSLMNNTISYKETKKYVKSLFKNDSQIVTIPEFNICVTIVSKLESEQKNRAVKRSFRPAIEV